MLDKSIDGALLALRKQGGQQGRLAEVLLDMRGVAWSGITQDRPMKRGQTRQVILNALESGPKTATQISKAFLEQNPTIGQRSATNRVYQALLRLEEKGLVVRRKEAGGCLWGLRAGEPIKYPVN